MSTLYASFPDTSFAEKATGALLDQGARPIDISIVANEGAGTLRNAAATADASHAEDAAKTGISTTTGADATAGAVKGVAAGIGIGIAAILAAVFVPGVGLVLGGGALATAMAGGAATVAASATAGGVIGYLKDQGLDEDIAAQYSRDFIAGGAILAVAVPTGSLDAAEVERILVKYNAYNVATYNSSRSVTETGVPQIPLPIENSNLDPIAIVPSTTAVVEVPVTVHPTTVIDSSSGETRTVMVPDGPNVLAVDPVTGTAIVEERPGDVVILE